MIRPLTPRQVEVLRLAADGLTRKQIAEHLFISVNTVRSLLSGAQTRLHTHNTAHSVAVAMREGIIR